MRKWLRLLPPFSMTCCVRQATPVNHNWASHRSAATAVRSLKSLARRQTPRLDGIGQGLQSHAAAAQQEQLFAGHRLRIEVSSCNFPRFDRNLNTGGNNYENYDESKGRRRAQRCPPLEAVPVADYGDGRETLDSADRRGRTADCGAGL